MSSGDQLVPSHLAMLLAGTPPALGNAPPAYSAGPLPSSKTAKHEMPGVEVASPTPGLPPNVGDQLGVQLPPDASARVDDVLAEESETFELATRFVPARVVTAVTCTLSVPGASRSSRRYSPRASVSVRPPALLTTTAPSAGAPSGAKTRPERTVAEPAESPAADALCAPGRTCRTSAPIASAQRRRVERLDMDRTSKKESTREGRSPRTAPPGRAPSSSRSPRSVNARRRSIARPRPRRAGG